MKSKLGTGISIGLWTLLSMSAACGAKELNARLNGLPSVDVDLARIRWHFSLAKPIRSLDEVQAGSEWKCVQRTAIARSNHTSFYKRTFAKEGNAVRGVATFEASGSAAVSKGLFSIPSQGALTGDQNTETDRYMFPYENIQVYFRQMDSNKLLEEWVAPLDATLVGRGFALVPELVVVNGQILMERAFSNTARNAFLYASCDLVKK